MTVSVAVEQVLHADLVTFLCYAILVYTDFVDPYPTCVVVNTTLKLS